MTLAEYDIYMEATELKELDKRMFIHEQAWANQAVKSTTGGKNPKPIYKNFQKFFGDAFEKTVKKIQKQHNPELFPDDISHAKKIKEEFGGSLGILIKLKGN